MTTTSTTGKAASARPSWHIVGHRLSDVFRAAGEDFEEDIVPVKASKCAEASPAPSSVFPSTCPGSDSDAEDLSDSEYDGALKEQVLLVVSERDAAPTLEQRAQENARWRTVGQPLATLFQALLEEEEL